MKTLVIGASGHIGAHLVRILLKEHYEVKALTRKTSDLKGLAGLKVELLCGDVLDPESLARAMADCDAVFHLGAPTALEPESRKIIEEGTKNVLECALRCGILKVVYTSSIVTVGYSSDPHVILDESCSQLTPASPYHIAKFHAEKTALDFSQKTGLPVVVVNPTTVIGSLDYRVTPSNLPIRQCLDRGLPFVFDSGLTLVHAEDVARGHLLAMKRGIAGQRYILGGDRMTLPEYFKLICRLCGRPKPFMKIPRFSLLMAGAVFSALQRVGVKKVPFDYGQVVHLAGKYGWYSSQKAVRELGYEWRSAEDAIRSYIEWARSCLEAGS